MMPTHAVLLKHLQKLLNIVTSVDVQFGETFKHFLHLLSDLVVSLVSSLEKHGHITANLRPVGGWPGEQAR